MKYLAFYDTDSNKAENRNYVLAATNKLSYMFEAMHKADLDFEVISASGTLNKGPVSSKKATLFEGVSLWLPASLGVCWKPLCVLGRTFIKTQLLIKLLKMKKGETLVVYHSLYYMNLVKLIKRIKNIRLVLEVEEIYGDVIEKDKVSKKEYDFCKLADAYIFPTALLDEKINTEKKPSVIIHGTYRVEEILADKFSDGKTHIVYAGTLDPRKGGTVAVATGEFLDQGYHIHILGFGNENDKETLLKEIQRVSNLSKCKVTFDGLLSGEDYIRFIQSCHIGLSPQNPNAKFNGTSFPSKILSYMANGLRVVSIRIPAIENSAIGKYICYYDEQTPEKIAEAIKAHKNNDLRFIISKLDQDFQNDMKGLLKDEDAKA